MRREPVTYLRNFPLSWLDDLLCSDWFIELLLVIVSLVKGCPGIIFAKLGA